MALVNEHFLKLPGSYLFSDIAKKVNAFKVTHPGKNLIRLGIGDVTRPLPPVCIEAMHRAVDEMANAKTFRGYGPEQGYDFLIEAIIKHDFASRGISLSPSEIFISDGAKSDTGNIGELLRWDNSMGITDPVYPVYVDSNIMCGRSGTLDENGKWSNVTYLPCTEENNFIPELPKHRVDLIYLCYPNNPTGTTLTHEQLKKWVDYALSNDTLIIFDAAYEAFIQEPNVPHSIYEIRGAKKVAIEIRSFSKTAGFTGVRCGYTVIPKEVTAASLDGQRIPLNPLWNKLHYPARRRSNLYPRRAETDKRNYKLLHGECPYHARRSEKSRIQCLRRYKCSIYLAESSGRYDFMEILRPVTIRGKHRKYSGSWFRSQR